METKKILRLILFALIASYSMNAFSKFQVKFSGGLETLGNKRGIAASETPFLIKVGLQNGNVFRWSSTFAFILGANYKQGDFGLGTSVYPLANITKSIVQPFLYVEGFLGLGRFSSDGTNFETRMDPGYNLGVGVDLEIFKKYGIHLMVENHGGKESSQRLLFGIYSKN
ncbi:hypothetical protein OAK75_00760 [Bacteriovoracales bacterium]|nr:hypothetical protein [Bacteriovoracales bacterium]